MLKVPLVLLSLLVDIVAYLRMDNISLHKDDTVPNPALHLIEKGMTICKCWAK